MEDKEKKAQVKISYKGVLVDLITDKPMSDFLIELVKEQGEYKQKVVDEVHLTFERVILKALNFLPEKDVKVELTAEQQEKRYGIMKKVKDEQKLDAKEIVIVEMLVDLTWTKMVSGQVHDFLNK